MKKIKIQIRHRKLGREKADGLAWKEDRVIEIDERIKGKNHLETVIHEVQHVQNPKWPEIMVQGKSQELAEVLWEMGYRRCEL